MKGTCDSLSHSQRNSLIQNKSEHWSWTSKERQTWLSWHVVMKEKPKQGQVNENLSLRWAVNRDHLIHSEAQFNTWGESFSEDNIYSVSWVRNQPNHFWSINPLNSYDNPMHRRCDSGLLYICEDWDTVSKFIIGNHMNRKRLSLDCPINLNLRPLCILSWS